MKYKPAFILFEQDSINDGGLKGMIRFFVDGKGYDMDVVRTLAVKYPAILSKKEKDFSTYFELIQRHGLTDDDAIKALIDCPKLISRNLEKKMKEILFLFNLYHGIKEKDVMDAFKSFPYLFCCDIKKI